MMSLVGGYPQPFRTAPDPGCYSAQYYGGRFDQPPPPPTAAAADSSYQLGWSFGGYSSDPSVGEFSPHHQGCVPMIGGAGPGSGIDYCMTAGTQPRIERGFKRRVTANRKERRRTLSINNAFAELRECIPNVPSDTKLSKIKTLRLATSYIAYLMDILAQDDPTRAPQGGFKAELSKKLESREERRKREILSSAGKYDKRVTRDKSFPFDNDELEQMGMKNHFGSYEKQRSDLIDSSVLLYVS